MRIGRAITCSGHPATVRGRKMPSLRVRSRLTSFFVRKPVIMTANRTKKILRTFLMLESDPQGHECLCVNTHVYQCSSHKEPRRCSDSGRRGRAKLSPCSFSGLPAWSSCSSAWSGSSRASASSRRDPSWMVRASGPSSAGPAWPAVSSHCPVPADAGPDLGAGTGRCGARQGSLPGGR